MSTTRKHGPFYSFFCSTDYRASTYWSFDPSEGEDRGQESFVDEYTFPTWEDKDLLRLFVCRWEKDLRLAGTCKTKKEGKYLYHKLHTLVHGKGPFVTTGFEGNYGPARYEMSLFQTGSYDISCRVEPYKETGYCMDPVPLSDEEREKWGEMVEGDGAPMGAVLVDAEGRMVDSFLLWPLGYA